MKWEHTTFYSFSKPHHVQSNIVFTFPTPDSGVSLRFPMNVVPDVVKRARK